MAVFNSKKRRNENGTITNIEKVEDVYGNSNKKTKTLQNGRDASWDEEDDDVNEVYYRSNYAYDVDDQ